VRVEDQAGIVKARREQDPRAPNDSVGKDIDAYRSA